MGTPFRVAPVVVCLAAGVAAGSGPDISPRPAHLLNAAARLVAPSGWNSVTLYRTADGSVVHRFAAPARIDGFAVSPDDQYLLAGGEGGALALWRVETGERVWAKRRGASGLQSSGSMAFAGDGARVAVCDIEGRVIVFDTRTGNEVGRVQFPNPMTRAVAVALDRDGRGGVMIVEGRGLHRFDAASGRRTNLNLSADRPVRFSADGAHVAFACSREAGAYQVTVLPAGDPQAPRPLGKFGPVSRVRPMPDGSFLVTSDEGRRADGTPTLAGTQLWPDGRIREVWRLDRRQGVNDLTDFLPEPMVGVSTDAWLVTTVTDLRTGQVVTRIDNSANRFEGSDRRPVEPGQPLIVLLGLAAAAGAAGVVWLAWRRPLSRPGAA